MKLKIRTKSLSRSALVSFLLLLASAQPIRAESMLPLASDLLNEWNGFLGGVVGCSTNTSYDAETLVWNMVGPCTTEGGTLLVMGTEEELGNRTRIGTTVASLVGFVDNSGQVLGGSMSIVGSAPILGIDEVTTLLTGTLIDACFSPDCISPGNNRSLQALVKIDTIVDPLKGLGDLLLWDPQGGPVEWGRCTSEEDCRAWQVSVPMTENGIGSPASQYYFYDSSTILPEPSSLTLFAVGLLLISGSITSRACRPLSRRIICRCKSRDRTSADLLNILRTPPQRLQHAHGSYPHNGMCLSSYVII